MALTQITNHGDLAVARLVTQFRGSASHAALIRAFVTQIQELEDAAFAVLQALAIDAASGEALDRIGAVVGCPRGALEDIPYRAFLHGQILADHASGTTEELISVAVAILEGYAANAVQVTPYYPGSAVVQPLGSIGSAPVAALARVLDIARAGGVRLLVEYEAGDHTIHFGVGPGLGTGTLAGICEA